MSARPRQTTIPLGPLIAAIGAVLLLVSLFLDWYEGLTGFTVFELVDIVLVVCALLIVLQLAGGMGLMKPPASPVVSLLVALFALGVVLTQLVNDPPAVAGGNGPDRDIGIWLAVAGALLMATGAFLATAQHLARNRAAPHGRRSGVARRSRCGDGRRARPAGSQAGRRAAGDALSGRRYVAVVGPGDARAAELDAAGTVGRELAAAGAVLVCGGLGGVMEAACRGASEAGGVSIGILPGSDRGAANRFVEVAIPTGLGEARNALVVRSADAVVAVGGGYGTLSEIAFALKAGKPVIGLGSWEIEGVRAAESPEQAVSAALGALT